MRWVLRRRREEVISEEIRSHLEMATRDHIARGLSPEDARLAAMREFGNVPLVQQSVREVWSWTWAEQLLQDVRFGVRILRHAPGLSATAIVLIALVIGGNTTIYSMVNSLIVSPARGVGADRLIVLRHVDGGSILNDPFISFPTFEDYARGTTSVAGLFGWSSERFTLRTDSGNYAVFGGLVTEDYFAAASIAMARGRGLQPTDDQSSDGIVAVISHRVWQERFAQSEDVIGRSIVINNTPATIVGVAGPGFAGLLRTPGEDLWLPLRAYYRAIGNLEVLTNRAQPTVVVAGRLRDGVSIGAATAEFSTLLAQLHATFPEAFTTYAPQGLVRLKSPRVKVAAYSANALLPFADMAPRFLAVFSIVTLITLLIVSANVANLMLARAVERQRDTAVRQSLGASRLRLLRMQFAEGFTLSLLASVAACLLAWWTSQALLRLIEPRPGLLDDARPDWTFLAYAMVLALLATVVFTMGPVVRAWRLQTLPVLKAGDHTVAPGRSSVSNALVVLQFSLAVLLVTSAGLAYRSLSVVDSADIGFQSDPLLLLTVRTGGTGAFVTVAPNADERTAAFARLERVREQLGAAGHVQSVTYGRRVPGSYFNASTAVWREDGQIRANVFQRNVGPYYLRTLGVAPTAGRELTEIDVSGRRRVAVINGHLARELFPGLSPLGQTLLVGVRREPVEVVGVAPDVLYDGPVHDRQPRYLFLAEQQAGGLSPVDPTFFIRHSGTMEAVVPLVSRALAQADPSLPIVSITRMNERLAEVAVLERAVLRFLTYFALVSLLTAALGQYAVTMFRMRRRTRDFGVRLALGASARAIEGQVLGEAFRLCFQGVAIGFILSAGTAWAAAEFLADVRPIDPPTYAAVFLLLTIASVVASLLPAWRAGRVSVVEALRQE
jgi:putative ABC transport system permease protein